MKIRILRIGQATHIVDVEPGATVGDALDAAHVETQGYSLSLNGLGTAREMSVADGDCLVATPKIVGGCPASA